MSPIQGGGGGRTANVAKKRKLKLIPPRPKVGREIRTITRKKKTEPKGTTRPKGEVTTGGPLRPTEPPRPKNVPKRARWDPLTKRWEIAYEDGTKSDVWTARGRRLGSVGNDKAGKRKGVNVR
jgi:hypothetical protein